MGAAVVVSCKTANTVVIQLSIDDPSGEKNWAYTCEVDLWGGASKKGHKRGESNTTFNISSSRTRI